MDTWKAACFRSLISERIRYTTAGVVTYHNWHTFPCMGVSVLINCQDWYSVVTTYILYNVDGRIETHNQTVNLAPN